MSLAAALFDLFGTLVSSNPWRQYRGVVAQMAQALGVRFEPFYQAFNQDTRRARELGRYSSLEENLAQVCERLGAAAGEQQLAQAATLRRDFVGRVLEPRPEALPLLERLTAEGLKLGLISNCSIEVPDLFQATPMAPLMQVCVFSSEVGRMKPDPELYRLACQRLGIEPQQALFLGDGGHNELSGASSLGMAAVLILPEGETFGLDEYRPEATTWPGDRITSLDQLVDLMVERGWIGR